MLALIAIVGILTMLLVVTTSLAYLVLPGGRMCPRCGGSSSPVVLRKMLRFLSRWVQWRWCARCGWEGPGKKGPELGILDPPVDHESGFRWGHPNLQGVPVFYWRDENETTETADLPSAHPSGFYWAAEGREGTDRRKADQRKEPGAKHPSGFYFRSSEDSDPPSFQWGGGEPSTDNDPPARPASRRPWYLSWFVSKETPGFHWKTSGD